MFVELSQKNFEKLKKKLDEMGVQYEVSDCTLPGEKNMVVHVELGALPEDVTKELNTELNEIYGASASIKDYNSDGVPDYVDEISPSVVERRHRKWDDKMHTPMQEAKAWFTGENQEEEVTYETH